MIIDTKMCNSETDVAMCMDRHIFHNIIEHLPYVKLVGNVFITCEASKLFHNGIAVSFDLAKADNVIRISDFK